MTLDAFCILVFVVAGRQSHGLDSGAGWFLEVLWPIALGWFMAALVARLYTARARPLLRLAATVCVGIGLGVVIRAAVTHRDTPVAFVAVAFGFIAVTTVGWRVVGTALPD